MHERKDWMMSDHFRSRISHDFSHSGPHIAFIAVNRTLTAGRLMGLKRAMTQSFSGIDQQLTTFPAKISLRSTVLFAAVDIHHRLDGFQFPLQSGRKLLFSIRLSRHQLPLVTIVDKSLKAAGSAQKSLRTPDRGSGVSCAL